MPYRNTVSLRGPWELALDAASWGRQKRWYEAISDDARGAPIPGIIQQVYPGYHGVAWYWLAFSPQLAPSSQERALLRFGAVDYLAEVWLNGQFLGGHEGGETPFSLDATAALIPERPNLLAVRVLNPTTVPIDGITLDQTPHEVMAAAFAVSYPLPGGYASGVLVGRYKVGQGHLILNTLHILEQVDRHPAADRLLVNLLAYAAQLAPL